MFWAYINYPVPHATIHRAMDCQQIMCHHKPNARIVTLNPATLSAELKKFQNKHYRFAANSELNDMWLKVDFPDRETGNGVVQDVLYYLGQHYRPLLTAKIAMHCEG